MSKLIKLISGKKLFINPNITWIQKKNYDRRGRIAGTKVTVCGAAGAVGQPLSLLLKQSSLIEELALFDIAGTNGFARELGHIDTIGKVTASKGEEHLGDALYNARIVVICSSKKRSGEPAADPFQENAKIVANLCDNIAKYCPTAMVIIITNPVNSLVPLAYNVLSSHGINCRSTLFGLCSLHVIRANTFVAEIHGVDPECVITPIVGGASDKTIVPILSAATPCNEFTNEEMELITRKVQNASSEATSIGVTPALSCAFAAARFTMSLLKALQGKHQIVACAYVKSQMCPLVSFLTTPLQLGASGILRNLGLPEMTEYESCLLDQVIPLLAEEINKGMSYRHPDIKLMKKEISSKCT